MGELTKTLCRDCVCWSQLPGEPGHGRCRLGPDWKASVGTHWCYSGQARMKFPPSERLEGEKVGEE